MNTFCQRLLNRLASEGWEDESWFHYGNNSPLTTDY